MKRLFIITALAASLLLSAQHQPTVGYVIQASPRPALSCPGFPSDIDRQKADPVDKKLRDKWEKTDRPGPGAVVMLLQGGKIKFLSGYGLANIQQRAPNTEQVVFDLASVSKQFTAVAIMKLVEQRKLSLDDSLPSLLPEFRSLRGAERIKVHHLLTHTSGLRNYQQTFGETGERVRRGFMPTNQDVIKVLSKRGQRLTFTPGDLFRYSNSGYVVLAQIVEAKSGMRFADFMRDTFFEPLGMKDTFVRDERPRPMGNHAAAYTRVRNTFADVSRSPLDAIYGDGNVHSTICDLARWLHELLSIYVGRPTPLSPVLISRASLDQVFTRVVTRRESTIAYGFGWEVYHTADLKKARDLTDADFETIDLVMHSGVWRGVRTLIAILPRRENGTIGVLLSNSSEFDPCEEADRIAKTYLGTVTGISKFIPSCRQN